MPHRGSAEPQSRDGPPKSDGLTRKAVSITPREHNKTDQHERKGASVG
jgi:hypothetical protein